MPISSLLLFLPLRWAILRRSVCGSCLCAMYSGGSGGGGYGGTFSAGGTRGIMPQGIKREKMRKRKGEKSRALSVFRNQPETVIKKPLSIKKIPTGKTTKPESKWLTIRGSKIRLSI